MKSKRIEPTVPEDLLFQLAKVVGVEASESVTSEPFQSADGSTTFNISRGKTMYVANGDIAGWVNDLRATIQGTAIEGSPQRASQLTMKLPGGESIVVQFSLTPTPLVQFVTMTRSFAPTPELLRRLQGLFASAPASTGACFRNLAGELQGKPEDIANARVTFWLLQVHRESLGPIADGKTDAQGHFAFHSVPWLEGDDWLGCSILAVVRAGDGVTGLREFHGADDDLAHLNIGLVPATTLTGVVRTTEGQPVADAWVWPWILGEPSQALAWITQPLPQWHVRTDAEGRFRMHELPTGLPIELRVQHPDFAELRAKVATATQPCLLALRPGARLEGVVHLPDGAAAVRVAVLVIGHDTSHVARVQTEEDGHYRVSSLPPDTYNVMVEAENLTMVALDSVPVEEGKTVGGQNLQLVRGGWIVGRVLDRDTAKAVKPGVQSDVAMYGPARPSGGACETAKIGADGTFRILAPPGRNRLLLRAYDGWSGATVEVDVVDGKEVVVELKTRRGTPPK